ncbi:MAG: DNA-binding protein YbiB [Betaproteobacteria bacterium]|nr:DNA-binding protein YbiB [Betaproteobacteria bacterium]
MRFARYIKALVDRVQVRELDFDDARDLGAALLDGGVPDLELGALMVALRARSLSLEELLGLSQALGERVYQVAVNLPRVHPVVIGSYSGAKMQANLLPLLAMLLQRFGIPVLIHGTLEGHGRVASAYILRELGISPSTSLAQAQLGLEAGQVVFVPAAVLSPGLAMLLGLRNRMGVRNVAHVLAKLMDPLKSPGLRIVGASQPAQRSLIRDFLRETGARALLLPGTDGEAFASPQRRPQLEYFHEGEKQLLFDAEMGPARVVPSLPQGIDAPATARWTRQVLAGETPLPLPLANQLACCLFGAGYTPDVNQAKAIVAFEVGVGAERQRASPPPPG